MKPPCHYKNYKWYSLEISLIPGWHGGSKSNQFHAPPLTSRSGVKFPDSTTAFCPDSNASLKLPAISAFLNLMQNCSYFPFGSSGSLEINVSNCYWNLFYLYLQKISIWCSVQRKKLGKTNPKSIAVQTQALSLCACCFSAIADEM